MSWANSVQHLSLSDHLSEFGLKKWLMLLNATYAETPRSGVRESLKFFCLFRNDFYTARSLSLKEALRFIECTDLSKPVRTVELQPDERVIAYRSVDESPFKVFYSRPGQSRYGMGINHAGRKLVKFRVRAKAFALESITTGAKDTWTKTAPGQKTTLSLREEKWGYMAMGGSLQLIIPKSYKYLEVE